MNDRYTQCKCLLEANGYPYNSSHVKAGFGIAIVVVLAAMGMGYLEKYLNKRLSTYSKMSGYEAAKKGIKFLLKVADFSVLDKINKWNDIINNLHNRKDLTNKADKAEKEIYKHMQLMMLDISPIKIKKLEEGLSYFNEVEDKKSIHTVTNEITKLNNIIKEAEKRSKYGLPKGHIYDWL